MSGFGHTFKHDDITARDRKAMCHTGQLSVIGCALGKCELVSGTSSNTEPRAEELRLLASKGMTDVVGCVRFVAKKTFEFLNAGNIECK